MDGEGPHPIIPGMDKKPVFDLSPAIYSML